MATSTAQLNQQSRIESLVKARPLGIPLPLIALASIIFIGAFLRFYNLGADGVGNSYYAAGVKAMLTSWHNFFFVAAEPGGSVSIDKPPLGFWLEAISAYFLGVTGFALALPQALAGVLSLPVLYNLVKRHFGVMAGLLAALVLAITPITIATERNNTIDGTLVFALLLAAWAFSRATETGRLRWLWIGAVMVGLAFNIKMMEAFLPLPACYALYLFAAKAKFGRKLIHLIGATAIVLVVSFAWAVIVDLTPASQRPYVGSSGTNSELSLILGYNGVERLLGMNQGGAAGNTSNTNPSGAAAGNTNFAPPAGSTPGQLPPGMTAGQLPPGMTAGEMPPGGGGSFGIGTAGVFRLFTTPLSKEVSWLLPLALLSLVWIALRERPRWPLFPLTKSHQAIILWGGWLLTGVVFFSVAGFFHPYYLIILGVPMAAVVGIGLQSLWAMYQARPKVGLLAVALSVLVTVGYAVYNVSNYSVSGTWLPIAIALAGIGLVGAAVIAFVPQLATHTAVLKGAAAAMLLSAVLITPAVWSIGTTFDNNPNAALPTTYAGAADTQTGLPGMSAGPTSLNQNSTATDTALIAYLQPRTTNQKYMVATESSMSGSSLVLATNRAVLYMGGFNGQDTVVTTDQLAKLVSAGDLSYILTGGMSMGQNSNNTGWLKANCTVVDQSAWAGNTITTSSANSTLPGGFGGETQTLYYCAVKAAA